MSLFSGLPDISALTEKRREFSEERILGYTPDKVYDVVADLNRYTSHCNPQQYWRMYCSVTRSSCRGARSLITSVRVPVGAMASWPLGSLLSWRDTQPQSCTTDPLPLE